MKSSRALSALPAAVARAVKRRRSVGAKCGLKHRELDRMESAFEHEDLELAVGHDV